MIASQLHPMLARNDRPDPSELLGLAWAIAGPLVTLTADETAFVERAHRADLDARMIFGNDGEAARRFEFHPQVVWKLENLRRHLGRERQ